MRYPGGKGGAGVFQAIINQFPPHRVYFEPFVGGGNVFERKAPAASSVLADLDREVVERWRLATIGRADVEVLHGDALEVLAAFDFKGDELVYLDPPYVHSTRRDLNLYRFEMSDADHRRLLDLAASIKAMVAISGYRSPMYDDWAAEHGWRRIDFNAMSRRGVRVESLWMNYPAPAVLADFSYAGSNFRERERIKRKAARWLRRWEQLPDVERGAILAVMAERGIAYPPGHTGKAGDGIPSVELAMGDRVDQGQA
ncbi:DNA adenine methylase [Roseateles chitinivorans]|uniref:DNA adenine methylase n=1 Tax=Roseateles chitinivorans TaxID=2917965 RepID=UPI003D6713CF